MSTLHTVNKSPFEQSALVSCLEHVAQGDAVLLIEDAVVGARKGSHFAATLRDKQAACRIYVLAPDLAARGIKDAEVVEGVALLDYAGFVDLVAEETRVCAWF
jgi:tRNA 2-thiouridine synthesizing protein B